MNIFEIYADTVFHLYRRSGFSFVNELEKRGSNHDMVSHFFKNTECISLECDRNCSRLIDHNPSHLFNAALSSDNPKLSKLSIDCKSIASVAAIIYTSVSQQINYISPFLFPTIVPHSVLPKCTLYDNLQELCVAELSENITVINEQSLIPNESPLYQIAGIINHQKRLKCVKLAGRLHTLPKSEALITLPIDFMSRPSFEELHIRSDLNTNSAVMLLTVFLTVPVTHEQRLVLSNVNCVGKCEKRSKLLSNLSTSPVSQQIKILQLHKVVFEQDMMRTFSKIPPVCLKVLKICNLEPILPTNISTCELIIDQLFSFMSLGEQLRHFLMNANIRTLHVCCTEYDYTRMNAYESLGHVLCDHA